MFLPFSLVGLLWHRNICLLVLPDCRFKNFFTTLLPLCCLFIYRKQEIPVGNESKLDLWLPDPLIFTFDALVLYMYFDRLPVHWLQ